jgi:hypothetical protein
MSDERTESAQWRKERPLFSGVLKYFPDALMEVAHCSFMGNQQHHKDKPLHWDKTKSTDEPDALMRHLKDVGTRDTDGVRHAAKVAWRALALLQREIDAERAAQAEEKAKRETPTQAYGVRSCGCPDCQSILRRRAEAAWAANVARRVQP